jgi:NADPH2:quinone reductase
MKAVYISEPGGPEVLEIREADSPVPGPGEVLIDVVAAGLNRADVQQRRGVYPPPPGASEIPGLEVSGRIAGFGTGVSKPFSLGDKVVALLAGGGYAQQVAVPAEQVLRVPDGVDLVTAASLPEVAATVYSNLVMTAQLQAGETVLIHGATGGIGTMAIQLAKALGKGGNDGGHGRKGGDGKSLPRCRYCNQLRRRGFPCEPPRAEWRAGR